MATEEFLHPIRCLLKVFWVLLFCWVFWRRGGGGGGGGGMRIWNTVKADYGMEISNIDFWFLGISSKKTWAMFSKIKMFELYTSIYQHS